MSDKNIDKDIELLKEMKVNCIKAVNGDRVYFDKKAESKAQAIENVLSELETYKKIIYELENITVGSIEISDIVEWVRKEVEKDE